MSKRIRLIATDLDSTLARQEMVSSGIRNLIFEVLKRGIKIAIASGRRLSDIQNIISQNGFEWGNPFPSFVISQERFILTPQGKDIKGAERWNSERKRETDGLISLVLSHLSKWLSDLRSEGLEPQYWVVESDNNLTLQYKDPEKAEKAERLVTKSLAKDPSFLIRRRKHIWVQITLPLGKGAALHHLSNILRLRPAEVLTIGDASK